MFLVSMSLDTADASVVPRPSHAGAILKPLAVIFVAGVMAGLILAHVKWINGPWYWIWSWRRLDAAPLYLSMILAAVPFFVGQVLYSKGLLARRWALGLVILSTLLLQFAAIINQPPYGLDRLIALVQNPVNTSYYTTATFAKDVSAGGEGGWIEYFPHLLAYEFSDPAHGMVHARFKPPGLMLYYWSLIRLFGVGTTSALVGALGIAIVGSLSVWATFAFMRFYARDDEAAFCGASFMAMIPSLILFFPQFDQTYPTIACLILLFWGKALADGRWRDAVIYGLLLGGALFLSYIFLVFGMFLVVHTMLFAAERGARGLVRAAVQGTVAVLSILALYGFLYAWSRFNPIETFRTISLLQGGDLVHLQRPFPGHIPFDLYDVALGTGFISVVLLIFYLARDGGRLVRLFSHGPGTRLAFLCLLQLATVAAAALLPGEAARLWLPLFPLLMVPIGLELKHWDLRGRLIVFTCLLTMTTLIGQNMTFLYMGPDLDGPRWAGWDKEE